jgi:hypothetical protein
MRNFLGVKNFVYMFIWIFLTAYLLFKSGWGGEASGYDDNVIKFEINITLNNVHWNIFLYIP